MSALKGFWSYVRDDDNAEEGRITRLAQDLTKQYELITGDAIELFLDRVDLEWGDSWQEKIDSSLASVAFFIPVLTPKFFQSTECRRELNYFVRQANKLGISGLIMPILYVDVALLDEDNPSDEAVLLVKPFHREDWRELRLHSPRSPSYRTALARMANKLAAANASAEETGITSKAILSDEGIELEKPGFIDLLAKMEEAFPKWAKTIEEVGKNINSIAPIMNTGTAQIKANDQQGDGLTGRLKIAKNIARELLAPAVHIETLGQQYTTQLYDVDNGIRLLIERLLEETDKDTNSAKTAMEFTESIRSIARSNNESLASLQEMLNAMSPLESMSRDLRKPLRSVRKGLTSMVEGKEIINMWVEMIDNLSLEEGNNKNKQKIRK
jgi:hypothetical protein